MELTIREIIHANVAIENILKSETKINFQTAYNLMKLRDEFNSIEKYVSERMKIAGLFSDIDSDLKKKLEEEIFNSKINVNSKKLSQEELSNDKNLSITLADMEKLAPILS